MRIYLDFDGTVVEHEFPKIGRCNFGCFEIIKKLQNAGHEIILNSYRTESSKESLEQALKFINDFSFAFLRDDDLRDIFDLDPIAATDRKIQPMPWDWERMEIEQVMYIDDKAAFIPLKKATIVPSNMVDWDELDKQFEEHGLYKKIARKRTKNKIKYENKD